MTETSWMNINGSAVAFAPSDSGRSRGCGENDGKNDVSNESWFADHVVKMKVVEKESLARGKEWKSFNDEGRNNRLEQRQARRWGINHGFPPDFIGVSVGYDSHSNSKTRASQERKPGTVRYRVNGDR